MKWLVVRYPEPAGKLIKLGSILTDPYDPESSLTQLSGIVPINAENGVEIRDHSDAVRQAVNSHVSRDVSASLNSDTPGLGSSAPSLATSLQGDQGMISETAVTAPEIKAEVFIPHDRYMDQVLLLGDVKKRLRRTMFTQSLYIIIGVATAKGLSITETRTASSNVRVAASLSTPSSVLKGQAKISFATNQQSSSNLSTHGLVDFAYRVREFYYYPLRGELGNGKDVTLGAMMSNRDELESEENTQNQDGSSSFTYLEEDDEDVKEDIT